MRRLCFPFAVLLLFFACSDTSDTAMEDDPAVLEISPSLVIGSGGFEGADCFGAISDAEFTEAGNIAVLDRIRSSASVFSRAGEYLYSLGRPGSGPGEFGSPDFMTSVGGCMAVFERYSMKSALFDSCGNYLGELVCSPDAFIPTYCTSVGESLFVGGLSARDPEGGDMAGVYMVIAFNEELLPVDTLYAHHYTLEYGDFSGVLRNTNFSCSFDGDDSGNVFIAPCSCEEYRVLGFDPSGNQFLSLELDRQMVRKSQDEIALEEERFNSVIRARNPGSSTSFEALEYRYMIPPNGVHADDLGRIWVRNGLSAEAEFEVYDYSGNILFTAVALGIDPSETNEFLWWTVDEYGLLCFSMDPMEYPVVYFYSMPEV